MAIRSKACARFGNPSTSSSNDSDHSTAYEGQQYRVIAPKPTERAIIVGDNAHVSDKLLKFADETGRRFLSLREGPANHRYSGVGIGLSFKD